MSVIIHKKEEFEKMRTAGKLAAQLLNELENIIKPGITTLELDIFAQDFCNKYKATSACYGYQNSKKIPFPKYICTSVNHVICHGIPSQLKLVEGDIISIDVTLIVNGYHGDTCKTYSVGNISKEAQNLINATKDAMHTGINAAVDDISNIGLSIENLIKNKHQNKYSIVEDYCGHGIGTKFHAEPQISHCYIKEMSHPIQEGMFFTVEPMINAGKMETRLLNDGWTVISKDYSLSAQFEHTIGIGPNGPEIFTLA